MLIFNGILYAMLVFLFLIYQKKKQNWKKQLIFEGKFERYLSAVMAAYGKNQNMNEALWEVEDSMNMELKKENTFVHMFYAMCEMVQADGDVKRDGTSVYLKNLQYLKEEIREHLLLYRERQYLFLGLDILCIVPVFFIPIVELWAIGASDTLTDFYHGSYGLLTTVVLFLATILIYLLVLWLLLPQVETEKQYAMEQWLLKKKRIAVVIDLYINRHYSACLKKNEIIKEMQGYGNIREFLVKKVLYGGIGSVLCLVTIIMFLSMQRLQIVNGIALEPYQQMLLDTEESEAATLQIKTFFGKMADVRREKKRESIKAELTQVIQENWKGVLDSEEILEKLNTNLIKYDKTLFVWYDMALIFFIGILSAQIPELFLYITKWKSKDKRMEECLRMQTVVLFLIHYDKTTVEELLCRMEEFAEVFHRALAKAVDSFSYQRTQTIERLKEDIVEEPMKRISEALIVSDELPVEQAFMNLEGEREYFLKKNMEERRHNQKEYAAVGKLLAYVPLMLLILFKMVVPFVAEGIGELSMYSQELTGLM